MFYQLKCVLFSSHLCYISELISMNILEQVFMCTFLS